MRTSFDDPSRSRGGPAFRWLLVATVLVGFAFGAWLTARLTTFTDSVFVGSERPAELAEAAAAPEDVPAVPDEASESVVETPATTSIVGTATVIVAPTATATATPRPTATLVDASTIAGKIRTGQRVSFLLVGYGGEGHDGAYLADAMVVVSFDARSNQLSMFNVPRDLWVQATGPGGKPTGPFRRINEIYGLGLGQAVLAGGEATARDHDRAAWGAAAVAQHVLGLPIDGWLSADFGAVRTVIDGLGGVTVTVETAFDDYEYPRHDDAAIDAGVMHVHFNAGPQRLTGERALQYARSRHAVQDGTDFGRARRQQRLLVAVKDEALRPTTLPKVFALMDAVQGHVRTSLSMTEARDLALIGRDRNGAVQAVPNVIDTRGLLIGTMTEGGASVLMPAAGAGNYAAIQRFVRDSIAPPRDMGANRKE